jgi:methylated-DNA-protein-cysteine methyltransferase-like protein
MFAEIYEIAAQVPEGSVATYGQIAAILAMPRGARTVGWAMRQAPGYLRLPCHRVVSSTGCLSPAHVFGGQEVQRARLESEGIGFLPDGRIDMKKHLWRGPVK